MINKTYACLNNMLELNIVLTIASIFYKQFAYLSI